MRVAGVVLAATVCESTLPHRAQYGVARESCGADNGTEGGVGMAVAVCIGLVSTSDGVRIMLT